MSNPLTNTASNESEEDKKERIDYELHRYKNDWLSQKKENIKKKWESSGLLKGLNKTTNSNITQLLESQFSQILSETPSAHTQFDAIVFSMIKRVSHSTLAGGYKLPDNLFQRNILIEKTGHKTQTEQREYGGLISVTPMSAPTGTLFYMDYKYNNQKPVIDYKQKKFKDKTNQMWIKFINFIKHKFESNRKTQPFDDILITYE